MSPENFVLLRVLDATILSGERLEFLQGDTSGRALVTILGSGLAVTAPHNTAELAGVDILAAALAPTNSPATFRIAIAFNAVGVFSATVTRGGNTQVVNFNSGVNLNANAVYVFDLPVQAGDTVNFRYSVNATLMIMRVSEVAA